MLKPAEITDLDDLIGSGALFIANHSGGKDSDAMYDYLARTIPAPQLIVVHVALGHIEWPGLIEHIQTYLQPGHDFHVISSHKTLFDMVNNRGMWPSPENRQCTSDLKRDPVAKLARKLSNERNIPIIVDCLGLRSQESAARSKQPTWKLNTRQTNTLRTAYTWHPILDWTIEDVWASRGHTVLELVERQEIWEYDPVAAVKGWNFHWVYPAGMERCSCSFCIMAKDSDLKRAGKLRPDLLLEYAKLERSIGHTFRMPRKNQPKLYLDELCLLS
ncbi:hypothetical protein GCM10028806_33770 [Spirosoma terrae]|uniref:Phosphoadenosine phosphosulfate reductase family protein n=1 Tax=Spirosoma terrae TaxID=1968276 RepID=A0A6L9LGB5_9BACT|nr:phosphoadenosine phosphosulfate reductase family protein [Spirosoma terrae]NDU95689.1 phosphoadenosine phosphosulfate reductase family protein [Spirosoma terrae]